VPVDLTVFAFRRLPGNVSRGTGAPVPITGATCRGPGFTDDSADVSRAGCGKVEVRVIEEV